MANGNTLTSETPFASIQPRQPSPAGELFKGLGSILNPQVAREFQRELDIRDVAERREMERQQEIIAQNFNRKWQVLGQVAQYGTQQDLDTAYGRLVEEFGQIVPPKPPKQTAIKGVPPEQLQAIGQAVEQQFQALPEEAQKKVGPAEAFVSPVKRRERIAEVLEQEDEVKQAREAVAAKVRIASIKGGKGKAQQFPGSRQLMDKNGFPLKRKKEIFAMKMDGSGEWATGFIADNGLSYFNPTEGVVADEIKAGWEQFPHSASPAMVQELSKKGELTKQQARVVSDEITVRQVFGLTDRMLENLGQGGQDVIGVIGDAKRKYEGFMATMNSVINSATKTKKERDEEFSEFEAIMAIENDEERIAKFLGDAALGDSIRATVLRSNFVRLGYMLAKIVDKDGRVSDADFNAAIRSLGGGEKLVTKESIAAAISNARVTAQQNHEIARGLLLGEETPPDFWGGPGDRGRIADVQSRIRPKATSRQALALQAQQQQVAPPAEPPVGVTGETPPADPMARCSDGVYRRQSRCPK